MEERSTAGHGGVWVTPWFAVAHVPGGIEQWSSDAIPLLLCGKCKAVFDAERRLSKVRAALRNLLYAGIVAAFIWFACRNMEFVAVFAKPIAVVVFIPLFLIARLKGSRQRFFVEPWLRRIEWASDMLDAEDEYFLHMGKFKPMARSTASVT